ncbi:ATP-binding protein [Okeania sp. SIO1I7]|uniref:ATP-binding protein n=1 Tax=Okeania sp. SIO1I7 TaxID=2607772 RepID=UPI0013F78F99|nr:ATP-binding protein [Okeania sp. SIO1I7]NET24471.1 ATP-binding protein [Okeania sp. SIO1I7]
MNTSNNDFTLNPYIFGKPIYKIEQLYGREETFRQIENNLKTNIKITLLHVQRRIGKTSLITCLPQFFTEEQNGFKFVTFSFQSYKHKPRTEILDHLADDIAGTIGGLPKEVRELADNEYNFFQLFLPKIINEYLSGKKLVLLLDEFDVLGEDETISTPGKYLFDWLEQVVNQEEKLFSILVFGRPLTDIIYLEKFLEKLKKGDRKPIEVGLLDKESTQNLIIKPAKEKNIEYESDAINAIWHLSAGHPSLTQLLCFYIFNNSREKGIKKVFHDHIDLILDEAIEGGEAVLKGFLEPLKDNEKLFFRAVAVAQNEVGENRLKTNIKNWQSVGKRLVKYGFLEEQEDPIAYKIKVELVRHWLVKNYPLSDEERLQMEKIPEKDENLPKINNNHKMPTEKGDNNSQGPNQIAKFLSLFVVSLIIVIPGIYSLSRIRNSSNSIASRSECSRFLQEINVALGDAKERSQVIEKVRSEWSRKEESLDLQCPYNYELDRKYNELLYHYGWNQINIGEYDKTIESFCEITEEYEKFREVENILSEWIFSEQKLSVENQEKVIGAVIEQNQSGKNCLAYSFISERNKNRLFEQQQKLSEQKKQARNESLYQQAQERIKSFEFDKAVEAYCQISEDYENFPDIQTQLQGWLSGASNLYDDEIEKVREKLTQLRNNCPGSPLK